MAEGCCRFASPPPFILLRRRPPPPLPPLPSHHRGQGGCARVVGCAEMLRRTLSSLTVNRITANPKFVDASKKKVTQVKVKKGRRSLEVTFEGQEVPARFTAEFLRVMTPSADRVNHGQYDQLVPGKRNLQIQEVTPVGNYAVRVEFSDGHKLGIYSWGFLFLLNEEKYSYMRDYIVRLAEAKESRDPPTSGVAVADKVLARIKAKHAKHA
eukprot:TRINITY_DN12327_c0_g2_i1.p1 TRINITY_DN12327_c0_g2~~TRINITY_DN12327_c0_g2_i1.p1  ORF type:complete len:211 (+),score=49.17 TRINITY_DN12327_c0_g2_i1:164-796(+)